MRSIACTEDIRTTYLSSVLTRTLLDAIIDTQTSTLISIQFLRISADLNLRQVVSKPTWGDNIGLSVKISRFRHLQKIIVNWLVSLLSLLRQQSLLFIDYIYFNKSKSYAWDMQAKLKERKIIMENFAALRKER